MKEKSRDQNRPMHVLLIFCRDQAKNKISLNKIRAIVDAEHWVLRWSMGLSPLSPLVSTEHPDLIVLITDDVGEQERAWIRYLRHRENGRRMGLVVLTPLTPAEDQPARGNEWSPAGSLPDSMAASHAEPTVVGQKDESERFSAEGTASVAELVAQCLELGADDVLDVSIAEVELRARLRAVLRQKMLFDELRRTNHHLKMLSLTDELTGLANMRNFSQRLEQVWVQVAGGVQSVALVMLDIDCFKRINDTSNHLVGSKLLVAFGGLLNEYVQKEQGEIAARYGGDEFILLLKATAFEDTMQRVENMRSSIASQVFNALGHEFRLTASFGLAQVACGYQGPSVEVIKAADLQLYRSKKYGRNRVSGVFLQAPSPATTGTRMLQHTKSVGRLFSLAG